MVSPLRATDVSTALSTFGRTPLRVPEWGLAELSGRLVELSGAVAAAQLTAAFGLVLDAQLGGDRAAWVTLEQSSFFPPDAVDGGIDLDALPIVRVRDARMAGRAADHLVRSGGFGLVVIDLPEPVAPLKGVPYKAGVPYAGTVRGSSEAGYQVGHPFRGAITNSASLPVPLLTRLLGLARQHDATVVILTRKSSEASSLHSLISLRAEARWRRCEGRYELAIEVLKDKRSGPGWEYVEVCRGPAGLR